MVSQDIIGSLQMSSMVRAMFELGNEIKKQKGEAAVFDFSLGNPLFEPPIEFDQALKKLIEEGHKGLHRYMVNAGLIETRSLIAQRLSAEHNLPFTAQHIVMTCGAGGGLNVLFKSLLDAGEQVLTFAPYFMEYNYYVKNHGGRLKTINTDSNFQPQLDLLTTELNFSVKALLINSPNNPSGAVYEQNTLDDIAKILSTAQNRYEHPIYLVSDEPYSQLIYDGKQNGSVFKAYPNSIVVTSHSKDYSLAGERIGYIAISPQIEEAQLLSEALSFCNRILGFVNAPALMQQIIPFLYKSDISAVVKQYQELRDMACDVLSAAGFEFIKPDGAFYIFAKSPLADDLEFSRRAADRGVLIVPGVGFGRAGYFRMSYSVPKERLEKSAPLFKEIFDQCQKI